VLKQNAYLMTMYEAGKAYGQPADNNKVAQDATVGVLFQTLFGPMFFGGSLETASIASSSSRWDGSSELV